MYLNIAETQQKSTTNPQLRVQQVRSTLGRSNSKMAIAVNYILHKCDFHQGNFFESEQTIAKNLGVSRRTVQRAVAFVRSLFMVRRKRRFNRSNVYSLAQWIRQESIIDQLADILPGLRNLLCLTILMPTAMWYHSRANAGQQEFGALYYIRSYEDLKCMHALEHKDTVSEDKSITNEAQKKKDDALQWLLAEIEKNTKKLQQESCESPTMQAVIVDKKPLSSHNKIASEDQKTILQEESTNPMAMYRLRDLVINATADIGLRRGFLQVKEPDIPNNVYEKPRAVFEFKEFVRDRLPRVIDDVNALSLPEEKRKEIIKNQLRIYQDSLTANDCLQLRCEGYPI